MVKQNGAVQKSLLGTKSYSEPCAFPQPISTGCLGHTVSMSLLFSMQHKHYRCTKESETLDRDKESVVETMAGCQGHPAVFSHWPNLVSFFLRVLS